MMEDKEEDGAMLEERASSIPQEAVDQRTKLNGYNRQTPGQSEGDHSLQGFDGGECVEEVEEEEQPQVEIEMVQCGFNWCAPQRMQRCAAIGPFTANASGLFLVNVAFFTYYLGVIRTLEKRFDLSSTRSSFTISMMDVMFSLLSLFIGYIGRRAHKPRTMVICQLLTTAGIFVLVLPFAVYGAKKADSPNSVWTASIHSTQREMLNELYIKRLMGLCVGEGTGGATSHDSCPDPETSSALTTEARNTYALLLFGSLLIGFGGVAVSNLGIPYIDENIKPNKSAFYVGLATSTYSWAPIVGLLLAAFCTRIPEDLKENGLRPSHPEWVGAWWLGMVILGTLSLLISLPMVLFPKHLSFYHKNKHSTDQEEKMVENPGTGRSRGNLSHKNMVENPDQKPEAAEAVEEDREGASVQHRAAHRKQALTSHLREFPRLMVKFFTNPAYVTLLMSKILGLYGVTGIILQLPRYMEIHYRQPAYIASIIAALSGSIVGAIGTVLGGYVMRRLNLTTLGIAKLFTMAAMFGMLGTAVCMAYGCPQLDLAGSWQHDDSLENVCTRECGCTVDVFRPVCVENFKTFFSPCHAGCREGSLKNKTYSDCVCAGPGVTLTQGYCSSDTCRTLVPYIVTFIIVSFLVAFGRVPATILMFRLVGEKDKAPVMGLTSFFINILCFVPAPILFGYLFDSACLVWKTSCRKTGACLVYDTTKFRLLMHGVTLAFQVPSCVFAFITLYIVYKGQGRGGGRRV